MTDDAGRVLRAGVPCHTDDGRLWDGERLYRPAGPPPRRGAARWLRQADAVVENRTDCCPGVLACGSLRVLGAGARARLAEAGFVRFGDPDGHVQLWRSEDDHVLLLLAGEVTRPDLG